MTSAARSLFAGLGFQPEELLAAGGQSAGILLGLDDGNIGGLLAKGDLSR